METALICGVSIKDYWNLTYGEIVKIVNAYQKKVETDIENQKGIIYQTAYLTAVFIGTSMSGKPIPSYEEIFPKETIADDNELSERDKLAMAMYRDQFIDYAKKVNERNRQKRGED